MKRRTITIALVILLTTTSIGAYYIHRSYNAKDTPSASSSTKKENNTVINKDIQDAVNKAVSTKLKFNVDSAKKLVDSLPTGKEKNDLTKKLSEIKVSNIQVKVEHTILTKPSLDIGKKAMIIVKLTNPSDDNKYNIVFNENEKFDRLDTALYSLDINEELTKEQADIKVKFYKIN